MPKLIMDYSKELNDLLNKARKIDCRTKSSLVRIAVKKYCQGIINRHKNAK